MTINFTNIVQARKNGYLIVHRITPRDQAETAGIWCSRFCERKFNVAQIIDAQKLKVTRKNKILRAFYLETFIVKPHLLWAFCENGAKKMFLFRIKKKSRETK